MRRHEAAGDQRVIDLLVIVLIAGLTAVLIIRLCIHVDRSYAEFRRKFEALPDDAKIEWYIANGHHEEAQTLLQRQIRDEQRRKR